MYTAPGVLPGGHPSNYGPGPALINFSHRANTDELTPYSVYGVRSRKNIMTSVRLPLYSQLLAYCDY